VLKDLDEGHARHVYFGSSLVKHKYLTNPSVTPEDQIIAAIGGLAKTLRTNIPPQRHDDTVENSKNYKTSFSQDPMAKSKVHHYKLPRKFQGCIHYTNMHQIIPQCKHPMLRLQGWQ
jgi:hypothetical protein